MTQESTNRISAGDVYQVPANKDLLPKFLRDAALTSNRLKVKSLPEGSSQVVEMETGIERNNFLEGATMVFQITLEVLKQLEKIYSQD